jgi:hypothetical protein
MSNDQTIDLIEIFDLFIKHKKIIILITVIFTFIAVLLVLDQDEPVYVSKATLEIGSLDNKLIQEGPELIRDLNIYFTYKDKSNLPAKIIVKEKRLVIVDVKSGSIDENSKTIDAIIKFIDNSHNNLFNMHVLKLTNEISSLNEKINFLEKTNQASNLEKASMLKNSIRVLDEKIEFTKKLVNEDISQSLSLVKQEILLIKKLKLPAISEKLLAVTKIEDEDTKNLELLRSNDSMFLDRVAKVPTLNQILHQYEMKQINLEVERRSLNNLLSTLENNLNTIKPSSNSSEIIFSLNEKKEQFEYNLKNIKSDFISPELFDLLEQRNNLVSRLEFWKNSNQHKVINIGSNNTIRISYKDQHKLLFVFSGFLIGLLISIFIVMIKHLILNNVKLNNN